MLSQSLFKQQKLNHHVKLSAEVMELYGSVNNQAYPLGVGNYYVGLVGRKITRSYSH